MSLYKSLDITDEVIKKVTAEVERINYTFVDIFKYSNHPSDSYLYLVVGQGGYKNGYAVWLYNDSLGGLFEGNYDLSLKNMFITVGKRLKDIEE